MTVNEGSIFYFCWTVAVIVLKGGVNSNNKTGNCVCEKEEAIRGKEQIYIKET